MTIRKALHARNVVERLCVPKRKGGGGVRGGGMASIEYYEAHMISFQTFFVWELLLIIHAWNSSPLLSNLLRLSMNLLYRSNNFWKAPMEVLLCELSLTFVTASFISSIVSSHWEQGLDYRGVRNCFDAHLGQIVSDKDGVVHCYSVLVEMPLSRFEECWLLPTEFLPELP